MDLVEIGNRLRALDERLAARLAGLDFLGFNLWKVYRSHIGFSLYADQEYHIPRSRRAVILPPPDPAAAAAAIRGKLLIQTSSDAYYEPRNEKRASLRLQTLVSGLADRSPQVAVLLVDDQKEAHAQGRLDPAPALALNGLRQRAAGLARRLGPLTLPWVRRHGRILASVADTDRAEMKRIPRTFLAEYLVFRRFFARTRPARVLMSHASYGWEAEIAALRSLNIPVAEYQHGHLYPEHMGYNFHPALRPAKTRMLFPDRFLAYGGHWRDALLDMDFFDPAEVVVAGHPELEAAPPAALDTGGRTPVLVCSQINVAPVLRRFMDHYAEHSPHADRYLWIVKPHPREERGAWKEFCQTRPLVVLSEDNTLSLLKLARVQVTNASTTLYEGAALGVRGYILPYDFDLTRSLGHDPSLATAIDESYTGPLDPDADPRPGLFAPFTPEAV